MKSFLRFVQKQPHRRHSTSCLWKRCQTQTDEHKTPFILSPQFPFSAHDFAIKIMHLPRVQCCVFALKRLKSNESKWDGLSEFTRTTEILTKALKEEAKKNCNVLRSRCLLFWNGEFRCVYYFSWMFQLVVFIIHICVESDDENFSLF